LLRLFTAPVTLCLAAQLLGGYMFHRAQASLIAAQPAPAVATGTNVTTTNITVIATTTSATAGTTTTISLVGPNTILTLVTALAGTITVSANLCALSWFGMWMGLSSKSTN